MLGFPQPVETMESAPRQPPPGDRIDIRDPAPNDLAAVGRAVEDLSGDVHALTERVGLVADASAITNETAASARRSEDRIEDLAAQLAALNATLGIVRDEVLALRATPIVDHAALSEFVTQIAHTVDAHIDEHTRRIGRMLASIPSQFAEITAAVEGPTLVGFADELR